ncbi:hypothetical protein, partial [Pseudomonas sp. DSP3-2-2]|uniref:hypothetical protein n=1 Tax=unclassified Pseudomonas TaxID=196821 RepID=UPI003CEDBFA3
ASASFKKGFDGGQLELCCVLAHEKHPRGWMGVQLLGCTSDALDMNTSSRASSLPQMEHGHPVGPDLSVKTSVQTTHLRHLWVALKH